MFVHMGVVQCNYLISSYLARCTGHDTAIQATQQHIGKVNNMSLARPAGDSVRPFMQTKPLTSSPRTRLPMHTPVRLSWRSAVHILIKMDPLSASRALMRNR